MQRASDFWQISEMGKMERRLSKKCSTRRQVIRAFKANEKSRKSW